VSTTGEKKNRKEIGRQRLGEVYATVGFVGLGTLGDHYIPKRGTEEGSVVGHGESWETCIPARQPRKHPAPDQRAEHEPSPTFGQGRKKRAKRRGKKNFKTTDRRQGRELRGLT